MTSEMTNWSHVPAMQRMAILVQTLGMVQQMEQQMVAIVPSDPAVMVKYLETLEFCGDEKG